MTITTIPFTLNHKTGILNVCYEPNHSIEKSGFDLFASVGFDVTLCLGYPTMHAYLDPYEGTGYYASCAWIQVVTRREFNSTTDSEPQAIVQDVDTHPTMEELGVPFFAFGFPAEIYDAPCNNLGDLARLEWLADTFLVTMPTRANNNLVSPLAGFRWGYSEMDISGKRLVEIRPLEVIGTTAWLQYLPLLRSRFATWKYGDA